ncbi:MAG: N-acetylmuramoyl-L-alanine amidase, partial [Desulfuromusa sp.]|nr:N-acetylmuramoyl-L-alanine amidase [Desulfuromusa sp.]
AKINESSRLAAEVQQSLVAGLRSHYSRIKDLGVKQGPFHVLLGATMPSVLIESGFISNFREEKRLSSSNYQKRVAAAIAKGVKKYAATLDQIAKR